MNLQEFGVATEYPEKDELTPASPAPTVSFKDFMGEAEPPPPDLGPPAWQSFMLGMNRANASTLRFPEAATALIYTPQNMVADLTGWNIGLDTRKIPFFQGLEATAKYFDQASEAYNYKARTYPGEDFFSLMGKGMYVEAGDYLAQSVIENAPTAMTTIAASIAGFPKVGLSVMGSQVGAQSYAEARDKNLTQLESVSFGVQQGSAEVIGESLGTIRLLKWGGELFQDVGEKAGKAILLKTVKLVVGSAFGEGTEEGPVQITQDLSSNFMGLTNFTLGEIWRRGMEAAVIGAASGATMTAPGAALQGLRVDAASRDKARAELLQKQVKGEPTGAIGTLHPISKRLILQPTVSVPTLLQGAAAQQTEFAVFLKNVTDLVPGAMVKAVRVKTPEKVATKIASGRSPDTISDYLGGRILVERVEDIPSIIQQVAESGRQIGPNENMFVLEKAGYRGYHIQVALPNGMSAELQVHVPEVAAVLDEVHGFYDQFKHGQSNDDVKFQMLDILDDAWSKYLKRVGAATLIEGQAVPVEPLAAEGDVASTALSRTISEGGITISTHGDTPTAGYIVSPYKSREVQLLASSFTPNVLERYLKANADLLSQPNHFLGAWTDGNVVYLDVVISHPDVASALALGEEHAQEAIWDVAAKTAITTEFGKARQAASDAAHLQSQEGISESLRATSEADASRPDVQSPRSDVGLTELPAALQQLIPVVEQLTQAQQGDPYTRNRFIRKADTKTLQDRLQPIREAFDKILGFSGSRLADINESLKHRLRRFDFEVGRTVNQHLKQLTPWLDKLNALPQDVQSDLDFALKNRDEAKVKELVEANDLTAEYATVRQFLDDIHRQAQEVGIDLGYLATYYPRHINDVPRFLAYLRNTEHWSAIQESIDLKETELGRPMDPEDRATFINALIRGYGDSQIRLQLPANVKNRLIDELTPEMNAFYEDSQTALVAYTTAMVNAIESRRLFGKGSKTIDDSIGAWIDRLVRNGEIDAQDEQTVRNILKARFSQKGTHGFWNAYKNLSYIYTMGSPISAVTQIGDLAFSLYRNGYFETAETFGKKPVVSLQDLGLDLIAQEFQGSREATTKAVRKVFTAIGLKHMDAFGKATLIQAGWERLQRQAKSNPTKLAADMEPIFGSDTDDVIADLKAGRVSDNVKYLLYSEVADFQPVSLSDMPEAYLTAGNARLFYMLKTYSLKLLDVYRNESVRKITNGQVKEGLGNLVRLTTALMLTGMTSDAIKDFLLGRDKELPDYVFDNLLKLMAFSKWQIYTSRRDGLFATLMQSILPPVPFFDDLIKDSKDVISGNREVLDLRLFGRVPLIGKFYYWWFGGGQEAQGP